MKRIYTYAILSLLYINYSNGQTKAVRTMNFDNNWLFYLGGYAGGENYSVNDSKWRKIDLPHDWSVEDRPGTKSPFSKNAISQCNEGFTTQGTGWYRKHFLIPKSENGKHVIIQFDGVYMNSIIYVNGKVVGNHPYGYTSFYYDITNKLKFGEKNIIAVQVINEGQNSRWYSGSGIYRHVWLKFTNAVHIVQWSTYITTSKVSIQSASINIKTQVVNENDENVSLNISTRIIDANGLEISKSENKSFLSPNEKKNIGLDFNIINPQLWSCSTPNLYKAYIEIYKNGEIIDKEETSFGIRKITFDVNNGFQLNDTVLKLKGGCFHDDNGPLGSKSYDRAEERKVELLKASGFNAIRCSHNPPSPAFLDACDRLGMLVIDEAFDMWNHAKTPYDYHLYFKDWWQKDLESMVTRDRNHPSIIIWSIGNEIPEKTTQEGVTTANNLAEFVRKIDPTRPVTAAVNDLSANNNPFFASLDLCGYNYAIDQAHLDVYELDHLNFPSRIMFGSESYPLKAFESWKATEEHPFVLGDFVWTAWDYIGEASIGWLGYPQSNSSYPWNLAFCGDIDICGWKRPQSYYRDALWKPNQLSVFVKPPIRSYKENVDKESWSIWNWEDVVNDWNWGGRRKQTVRRSSLFIMRRSRLTVKRALFRNKTYK